MTLPLKSLIKNKLFSGQTIKEHIEDFNLEEAINTSVDNLRLCIMMKDEKQTLMALGACGALGIEIEDCKFIKKAELEWILSIMR